MNQEEFKSFFQKTIKDLNMISVKLMNKKNSVEEFELLSSHQDQLQQTLQKADQTLKSNQIKEALQIYDLGINNKNFNKKLQNSSNKPIIRDLSKARLQRIFQYLNQGAQYLLNKAAELRKRGVLLRDSV